MKNLETKINLLVELAVTEDAERRKAIKEALAAEMTEPDTVEEKVNTRVLLRQKVTNLIHEIGVPAHIKGYQYVREAIILAVKHPNLINAITYELYPQIAETFQTTPSRVERAIRHAIEVAWTNGDMDTLVAIFGYTVSNTKGKPTNSQFIALLADRILMEGDYNEMD